MASLDFVHQEFPNDGFLAGGGELGALMRETDWSQSALGPAAQWPQALKTAVRIMLTSRQPMFVWWGDELINLGTQSGSGVLLTVALRVPMHAMIAVLELQTQEENTFFSRFLMLQRRSTIHVSGLSLGECSGNSLRVPITLRTPLILTASATGRGGCFELACSDGGSAPWPSAKG